MATRWRPSAHITELRTATNALRAAASLSAAIFTDPDPAIAAGTTTLKAAHLMELRSGQ